MIRILHDARFALRLLWRSPGFAATLLGVLVAGIGATTAMFSIVESLLLRPLPYPHSEQLTMVWATQPHVNPSPVSIADFLDWKAQGTTFEHMAATDYASFSLSSEGERPEHLPGAEISGDFFATLGISAQRGRLLGPDDDRVDGPRVAVLSASVWHRRFGSDPQLVGKTITLNSEPFTVVGIAPEGFRFSGPYSDRADVWIPLAVAHPDYAREVTLERGSHFLHVLGRRKVGVSIEQAQAQLSGVAKSIEIAHPDSNTKVGVRLQDLHDALVGSSREGVWVLFAAVALVFLVVCANVANLLLTRAAARRAEMAARAALGATPRRLAAQIVTETVVVFLLGGGLGGLLAVWLVDLFASGVIHGGGASTIDIRVDALALLFCVVTCLVCGLVFGLVPAMEVARVEPQAVLKASAARAGTTRSQRAVRGGLVVAQVALAFALLAGGGLALRAFAKLASTPPGFDPTHLATARAVLPETKYKDDEKAITFYREVIARIAVQPGVESVAANNSLPMSGSNSSGSFSIEGREPWRAGERPTLERNIVTPGYFETMRIPLLRGREFTDADRRDSRLVLIISEATAKRFFPGEDPIGRRIDWGESDDDVHVWREIVGVVGDVRRRGLTGDIVSESFAPLAQHADRRMMLVVRSSRDEALLQELPALVASVDPQEALANRRMMTERVADSVGPERFTTLLLGAFAAAALLLATLGVFGLVSYSTSQRTRELGIRMALGSSPFALVALVARSGLRLVGAGLAIGLVAALLVGRALATRVIGVVPFDLTIYTAIPAVLGTAGLVACLVPALRAVRVAPAIALRYE